MNRRQLLAGGAGLVGLTLGLWPRRAPAARLRPPGAMPPGEFEERCIRCFRCAEVCPPKAIVFDGFLQLRENDLPFIDAKQRACVLCMECTQVCPTGALDPIAEDPAAIRAHVRMGRPVLDRKRCITWIGTGVCRLCYYACPFADEAIRVTGPRQAPIFVERDCVGCGLCEEACPERARAIHIVPTSEAPA
jgi:ferredoxin